MADTTAARGDQHAAAAELRAARELFAQMRAPRLVASTRRLAAELRAARELFAQMRAPRLVASTRRLAAELGVSLEAPMLAFDEAQRPMTSTSEAENCASDVMMTRPSICA